MKSVYLIFACALLYGGLAGCSLIFSASTTSAEADAALVDATGPDAATVDAATVDAADADGAVPSVLVCPEDANLVLCHEYEDSLFDFSGNDNHAVAAGGINFAPGMAGAGQALQLDGDSDVTVAQSTSLQLGPMAMTLEAWVFPKSIPVAETGGSTNTTNRVGIVDGDDDSANDGVADSGVSIFIYAAGAVGCYAGNRLAVSGTGKIAAGSWAHLACTHLNGTTRIYVDGEEVFNKDQGGNIISGTMGLAIGGNSAGDERFEGAIDNLRVWTVARTAVEICAAAQPNAC